jgi:hypothetical protein
MCKVLMEYYASYINWNCEWHTNLPCEIYLFIYLFIHNVFNDTVNKSDYIVSNGRMIREKRDWKDVEGSGRDLLFEKLTVAHPVK